MVFFLQVLSVLLHRPYDHSCSMSIPVHFIDGTTQVSQTLGDLVCYYSSIVLLVHYRANCKQADLPTKRVVLARFCGRFATGQQSSKI